MALIVEIGDLDCSGGRRLVAQLTPMFYHVLCSAQIRWVIEVFPRCAIQV